MTGRDQQSENQHVEWKESWHDEYIKWICGFANANGGILAIGKNDKGEVKGLPNAEKLLEQIPNKVLSLLGIIVDVNLQSYANKKYIEIIVDAYPYPVNYKGQYHYRSGSTKQELKGPALDKFLLKKQGKRWDGVPLPHISIDDFHANAFELFRLKSQKSGRMSEIVLDDSNKAIIDNLHLMESDFVRRAGVLLFHQTPEKYVDGAYIKLGFFRTDAELLYQDEIHGSLFDQVDKTLDLILTKYLRAYISYEGITRVETYPFPKNAIREVLLNAIVHKDYSSGVPIQISVYENKIYFWNDGQLPETWTIENLLKKHPSNPYNPLIANAFFRAGLIESWGRGIEKIHSECSEKGSPPPEFSYDANGLMVKFQTEESYGLSETLGKTLGKTPLQILKILSKDPYLSIPQIAEQIQKSDSATQRAIRKLREAGLIERIGSAKAGHWKLLENDSAKAGDR